MNKQVYTIYRDGAWLTSELTWTYYGPELAGFAFTRQFATKLIDSVGGIIIPINANEANALSLEPFEVRL